MTTPGDKVGSARRGTRCVGQTWGEFRLGCGSHALELTCCLLGKALPYRAACVGGGVGGPVGFKKCGC